MSYQIEKKPALYKMFNFNQHEIKISTGCCIFAALLCSYSCGRKDV